MANSIAEEKKAVETAWIKSNGKPITYADKNIFIFGSDCHISTDAGFIIPPYIISVAKKPKTESESFVLGSRFF